MKRKDMLRKFKMLQDRNMTTVRSKNKTYGAEGDAFQAFKDAVVYGSKIETQPQALWNMMSKHLVTVKRWVDGGVIPSEAEAAEKLGDLAVYMSLLELMFEDKRNEAQGYLKACAEYEDDLGELEVSGSAYTRVHDKSKDEASGKQPVSCEECQHVYAHGARCDITGREVRVERGMHGSCGVNGVNFKAKEKEAVLCVDCDHAQDGNICGLTGAPTADTRKPGHHCGPEGRNFKVAFVHICNGCQYLAGVQYRENAYCVHRGSLRAPALEIRKDESKCGDKAKWYKPGLGKSLKRETERPVEANGVSCKTCRYHGIKGYILCGKYGDLAEDARLDDSRCGLEGKSWSAEQV